MAESQEKIGFIEPDVEEINIKSNTIGTFSDIAKRLSSLELFYIRAASDSTTILRIESRDIQKRPFLFFIITLERDNINVQYSIAHDSSVKMRRLYIVKNLLSTLSLITDLYEPDNTELFQHVDSAIDDVVNSISQSYSALFNNYDSLFNEYREIKRLNIELTASNKNLTVQGMQLSTENKELSDRLKTLEAYSDESLMVMVQDWIETHDNTIDINEFCKVHKVPSPRIEQILNKMVSLGYIEAKG